MLLRMDQTLQERIKLLEDNLLLKKKQAEVGRALATAGQEEEIDVVKVEVEYLEKQNDLATTKRDLYLTRLNLLSLMGEDLEKAIVK
jgi:outer membrane protein TolC